MEQGLPQLEHLVSHIQNYIARHLRKNSTVIGPSNQKVWMRWKQVQCTHKQIHKLENVRYGAFPFLIIQSKCICQASLFNLSSLYQSLINTPNYLLTILEAYTLCLLS